MFVYLGSFLLAMIASVLMLLLTVTLGLIQGREWSPARNHQPFQNQKTKNTALISHLHQRRRWSWKAPRCHQRLLTHRGLVRALKKLTVSSNTILKIFLLIGIPDAPSNFHVTRKVGQDGLLVAWNTPVMDTSGCSNGATVSGYQVRFKFEMACSFSSHRRCVWCHCQWWDGYIVFRSLWMENCTRTFGVPIAPKLYWIMWIYRLDIMLIFLSRRSHSRANSRQSSPRSMLSTAVTGRQLHQNHQSIFGKLPSRRLVSWKRKGGLLCKPQTKVQWFLNAFKGINQACTWFDQ